ncbi:hypothetical protein BJX70DRAFT_252135 [Aspergillus crustosus]
MYQVYLGTCRLRSPGFEDLPSPFHCFFSSCMSILTIIFIHPYGTCCLYIFSSLSIPFILSR